MPAGDIYQVRIECGFGTQASENIRHWRVSAVVTPEATPLQIATIMNLTFAPHYKALLSSSATYRGVGVRRIFPLPLTVETVVSSQAGPGLVTGDPLPKQTSGVITLRTGFAGRKFRGRVYVPFPGESDNTGSGFPGGGYLNALIALAPDFQTEFTVVNGAGSSVLVPIIWHRRTMTFDAITSTVHRLIWGTQRRRGDYGRPNPPTI